MPRGYYPRPSLEERFWAKVNRSGECWIWTAYKDKDGYGQFQTCKGKPERAHRVAYSLVVGAIPEGKQVLHSCDNPPCVRPSHLWLGSNLDNIRDMDRKGRRVSLQGEAHPMSLRPEKAQRGENRYNARLKEGQIPEIRSRYFAGEDLSELAGEFGVSRATITYAARRRNWKHVK